MVAAKITANASKRPRHPDPRQIEKGESILQELYDAFRRKKNAARQQNELTRLSGDF